MLRSVKRVFFNHSRPSVILGEMVLHTTAAGPPAFGSRFVSLFPLLLFFCAVPINPVDGLMNKNLQYNISCPEGHQILTNISGQLDDDNFFCEEFEPATCVDVSPATSC